MRRINVFVMFFLLAGLLVVPPQRAFACTCMDADYASPKFLDTMDAVFVGRVISVAEIRARTSNPGPYEAMVTFFVQKGYKGIDGAVVEVASNLSGVTCGLDYVVGREYLVFATSRDDVLLTSVCNGSRPVEQAGDLLTQLREYAPLSKAQQASFAVSIPVRRNELWNCRRNFACVMSFRAACENLSALPTPVIFCR